MGLLLLHPGLEVPREEWVPRLAAILGRWIALHIVLLPLFALLGAVVYWMLPVRGRASRVSRVALLAYIVLYPAFDAAVGLGSGALLQTWRGLSTVERATLEPAIM